MKPKFLLTIVILNTLFLGISIATASTIKPEHNITKLSQSISKLVGLNPISHPVVAAAIDRAITTKQIAVNKDKNKGTNPPQPKSEIMGKVAVPKSLKPTKITKRN